MSDQAGSAGGTSHFDRNAIVSAALQTTHRDLLTK